LVVEPSTFSPRGKLSKQVARVLANMIVKGDYKPRALLPSEADLGTHFGVSRTVIREAVLIVEAQGLVHIRHGIGTQVTAGGQSAFTSAMFLMLRRSGCTIRDVFDFRRLVEPEFAATAALRATPEDLMQMEQTLEAYVASYRDHDPTQAEAHHLAFHQAIHRATHNPVVEAMIDPMAEMLLLSSVPYAAGVLPCLPSKELLDIEAHRAIFACIKSGDSQGAHQAMRRDFETARTDIDTSVRLGGSLEILFDSDSE